MYFWRARALAEDLRAGRVTERQRMWYLLSQTMAFSIFVSSLQGLGEVRTILLTAAECAAWATINAVGVLLCFEVNRRGDNVEFMNRFVCLSWPLRIRFLAPALLVLTVVGVLAAAISSAPPSVAEATVLVAQAGSDITSEMELGFIGVGLLWNVRYYWRLRSHLRWVAAANS